MIPLQPTNDTAARHRRPAEERIEEAAGLLTRWRRQGLHPQIEWGSPVGIVDPFTEERLPVPSYLLPEMILLLAKSERVRLADDPLRPPSGLRWADSGGGAA